MDVRLLGQGYNLEIDTSLASELIAALNDEKYSKFNCLVAFASFGGISALTPHIAINRARYEDMKVVVGIDQQGTSKEALEELLSWNISSFIYHSTSRNIFHPKIYLFEGVSDYLIFIGSNNFTESGLVKNVECSVKISHHKTSPDDRGILNEFEEYFDDIFNVNNRCVNTLTQDLVNVLFESGLVSSERLRDIRHERKTESDNQALINRLPFGRASLQHNPDGFSPRRTMPIRRQLNNVPIQPVVNTYFEDGDNWMGSDNNLILLAEIGAGTRWKQVNFPIAVFQNFFGAIAGDNSYHIRLRHMTQNGDLEDVEFRQAVSVRSNNFRFEIGTAIGGYPIQGRPIGVFIKVAQSNFLYRLLMPNDAHYNVINDYLILNHDPLRRQGELKRKQTTVNDLPEAIRNLPFL